MAINHESITLTLVAPGDPSVGIWGDEIVIRFSGWIGEYLDDPEYKDDKGRTWRQQIEQDSIDLYRPFMDDHLTPYWSDKPEDSDVPGPN